MADLGGFAGQAAPVARDLNASGTDVSRLIRALGPFSTAATPALASLGRGAGDRTAGADPHSAADPGPRRLRAARRKPLSTDLDKLTTSLDKTGGIERLVDFLFFSMLAINGFDGIGHYLRAALSVNLCTPYATEPRAGLQLELHRPQAHGVRRSREAATPSARIAAAAERDRRESDGSVPPTGERAGRHPGHSDGLDGRGPAQRRSGSASGAQSGRRRSRGPTSRCSSTYWGATE